MEETEEPKKNKGGRPAGSKSKKKELKDDVADLLNKRFKETMREVFDSDELSPKEKAAIIRDLLPYAASKKSEDKKEIPDNLKYVKIIIKGYNPDEDPFTDKVEETEREG